MGGEFQTQIIGILLAAFTAIGCLGYERIVKSLPYKEALFFVWMQYFWIWIYLVIFTRSRTFPPFSYWKEHKWAIAILFISGITSPLWYWLTKKHSVLVGGVFEIKYIIVLALLSYVAGEQKPTVNTYVGAVLAILSVYFISKK